MKAYEKIRRGMRLNEVSLLRHLRRHRVTMTILLGRAWNKALDRLEDGGQVKYRNGAYRPKKGARPVTPAIKGAEIKLTKEQARYIATWIIEESRTQSSKRLSGDLVLQAADAWNGGAR